MLGTEMAASGVQPATISQVLGQRGVGSVKRYISPDMAALRACAIALEELREVPR